MRAHQPPPVRVTLPLDAASKLRLALTDWRARMGYAWPPGLLSVEAWAELVERANPAQSGSAGSIAMALSIDTADHAPMTTYTYSLGEAAELLGVSLSTVKRAVAAGRLPAVTFGRRRRIPAAALERLCHG